MVKYRSGIKNTPIKLEFCTQGFFKVGNLIKLIIFNEIEISLIKGNFRHLRAQKWVKIVAISKTSPKGF